MVTGDELAEELSRLWWGSRGRHTLPGRGRQAREASRLKPRALRQRLGVNQQSSDRTGRRRVPAPATRLHTSSHHSRPHPAAQQGRDSSDEQPAGSVQTLQQQQRRSSMSLSRSTTPTGGRQRLARHLYDQSPVQTQCVRVGDFPGGCQSAPSSGPPTIQRTIR